MEKENKKVNFVLVMIVYLAGIFMGAIDTGIITPARTVIQNNLMVDEKTGIWMITIYTLAYAASIPIMGKLADKYGRKYVYLVSIFLFGLGSLFCGLAQDFSSFTVLIIARAVQAIGGGGIVPIATAEFGTTFPKEKRGMALGLVGGVYGIANIFGASAGSAILDIFGKDNWQFIFYINIPITLFILIAGFYTLQNTKEVNVKKIDILGISILTIMVLSLLYGLKNIDFFNFKGTLVSSSVYPYLLVFIVLLPIFIFIEKKAEDPVMNLTFFTNSRIIITLVLAFITGVVLMGMIFVPQFSENALKIASGSGGYFVIILGLFAGVGAPVSGKLIDRFGARVVIGFGFIVSIIGSLYLILVAANTPSSLNVVVSLILIGIGMGFTIGAPLNYMMLENTKLEESNSALATLSLIRSIGTAIAPAIMVGFIAHAGANVQTSVMESLPREIELPALPYAKELTNEINKLKANPVMREKLKNINFPDFTSMNKIEINISGSGDYKISKDLLEFMKTSDVTTITKNTKILASSIFNEMTPKIVSNIQGRIQSGIDAMKYSVKDMYKEVPNIPKGYDKTGQENNYVNLVGNPINDTINKMNKLKEGVPGAFETAKKNYLAKIDNRKDTVENKFQMVINNGFKQVYTIVVISSFAALIILIFYKKKAVE
ncbi:MFS transporter [Clostridium cylindrosporum]|uniref:Major facilitator superfamily transporter n=1 Tax=Clostridium cylindrosporum DSM 605 TaxID=1121307 RepID=A0A0J8D4F0_CLOCY|nr:MFS transporter [Clostridium cylindrosporum]KMT21035.1 major facilitator superfamily transporter [Clostridium cylindrosporum DSM 605]